MKRNRHAPHAYLANVECLPGDAADLAAARSDEAEEELTKAIYAMGKRIQAARFEFERDTDEEVSKRAASKRESWRRYQERLKSRKHK